MKIFLFILLFSPFILSSSYYAQTEEEESLLNLNKEILSIIKEKDYSKFASYIHPTQGLRFSPYAYIDTISDLKFDSRKFSASIGSDNRFKWGYYDGSGNLMNLTVEEYFKQFVYDANFLNPELISLNEIIGSGNSLNNLDEAYPNCKFVESYFSGFNEKFGGMDWCTLRLVFKKYQDRYYLVGIVHDEWTI